MPLALDDRLLYEKKQAAVPSERALYLRRLRQEPLHPIVRAKPGAASAGIRRAGEYQIHGSVADSTHVLACAEVKPVKASATAGRLRVAAKRPQEQVGIVDPIAVPVSLRSELYVPPAYRLRGHREYPRRLRHRDHPPLCHTVDPVQLKSKVCVAPTLDISADSRRDVATKIRQSVNAAFSSSVSPGGLRDTS